MAVDDSYRDQKVKWVSGHVGSSVADINKVSLAMPLSILLWSVAQSRMRVFTPYTPVAFLADFLLNCGATLFATTVYSSSSWVLNLLLLLPAIMLLFLEQPVSINKRYRLRLHEMEENADAAKLDALPVKPFITNYRGAMMIITCVAILAVDFQVFPRRFAKVENWGTSLMDMGVGSFVFTAGIVSVRALLKETTEKATSQSQRLWASLRHALPLFVLGLVRLISVKKLDYAEHVTEYGVHWNFFITLACLPPSAVIFRTVFDLVPSYALLSFALATAYEIALDCTPLGSFILAAPRTNLFSQNREGIFSFFGYLAIFLAGQSLGSIALPRQQPLRRDASKLALTHTTILGRLATASIVWTALFYISTSFHGPRLMVSRRLANLPYFLWVASFNSYQLTICCAIETFLFPNVYKASTRREESRRIRDATSTILYAFNRNALAVFLVANILTGLVNMTMPTLHMNMLQSMAVLVTYIITITVFAVALDLWGISIKL